MTTMMTHAPQNLSKLSDSIILNNMAPHEVWKKREFMKKIDGHFAKFIVHSSLLPKT